MRDRLRDRLMAEDADDLAAMLEKCGNDVRLRCVACTHLVIGESRCEKRWCPVCAYHIAAERVKKYEAAAGRFRWPLFVTLTIQNTPDPEGLMRLKKWWQKFRRRKLIRECVRSGIVGFEITNKGRGWHPHIHCLLDCQWLSLYVPEPNRTDSAEKKRQKCQAAAEELSRAWADLTGQETASVKVRRGDAAALVEVLKYSCKGSELLKCAEPVAPLIRLMLGCRLMSTFGEIRKEMQDEDLEEEKTESPCQCEFCGAKGSLVPENCCPVTMPSYHPAARPSLPRCSYLPGEQNPFD
jgi:hypothetical protein